MCSLQKKFSLRLKRFSCFSLQVLLVYGLAFMVILPVVVVSSEPAYLRSYYTFVPSFNELLPCCVIGNVVVSLHPIQRRPDPHQHHPALHAFLAQDAQHEYET